MTPKAKNKHLEIACPSCQFFEASILKEKQQDLHLQADDPQTSQV